MKVKLESKFLTLKNILISVLLIVCAFLYVDGCNKQQNLKDDLLAEQVKNQKLDSVKNKLNQTVYRQQVIITDNQKALKAQSDEAFNLKKSYEKKIKEIQFFYKNKTKTELKEVLVPYVDTAERKRFSDSVEQKCKEVINYLVDSTVTVGSKAAADSQFYKINLTVEKTGIKVDSISFSDSQYLRIVTIKGGFLKKDFSGKRRLFLKKYSEVQVLHTNPYIKITGQNSIIYKKEKKRILEKIFMLAVGVYVGTKL